MDLRILLVVLASSPVKGFIVATAVCGNEYIPAGQKLLRSIGNADALVIYETESVRLALWAPNVHFYKTVSAGGRFRCSEAKLSLYRVVDDVLWIDLDTVIVGDITSLSVNLNGAWAAACPESIDSYKANWYKSRHSSIGNEYVKPNGINTGVMYFNTTAWRAARRAARDLVLKKDYSLPDQDTFNVYFSKHPDELALLPMQFNYRGRAVSGSDVVPVIHHRPGTKCAKRNSCLAWA